MTQAAYVVPPQPVASLPVEGEAGRFPVGRIFCIGRNYAAHAAEMGHDSTREPPFFFLKPATALRSDGIFQLPATSQDVHHEVEMIVGIGLGGAEISPERALEHVYGYGVGLDMTQRDLQAEAKKLGRPWDFAKGFDGSAPCGALVPAARIGHPRQGEVSLKINGELRQTGDLKELIWSVPEIIAIFSRNFHLLPGDLIMTGTPAGVGRVKRGDRIEARVEGVGALRVETRCITP